MNTSKKSAILTVLAAIALQIGFAMPGFAQGTAFTYQGQLQNNGSPANGNYDLTFALFDAASSGGQQGNTLTNLATATSNGLFTVTLDFGNQFPGAARWLEIGVRTNGGTAFATLAPRQPLTASPYAVQALNASLAATASSVPAVNLTGKVPLAQLPAAVVTNGASGVIITGTFTGNGAGLTNLSVSAAEITSLNGAQITSGSVPDSALSANVALLNRTPQHFTGINTFAGNVGIGTTTPGFPLNLASVLGDKIALYGNSGSHYGLGVQPGLLQIYTDGSGSDVAFGYGQSSPMTETMRIKGNGYVGIGTSTPAAPLDVFSSGFPSALIDGSNIVGTWLDLRNTSAGGETWQFISTGPGNGVAGNLQLGWGPTPTSSLGVMTLRPNGNVGIGTTTPAQALDVNGDISLSGTHFVFNSSDGVIDWGQGGVLYFRTDTTNGNISSYNQQATLDSSGNFTCAALNITSDRNAKEDFQPVSPREVLAKVAALPITEWQYKNEKARNADAVRHIGPMAQDFSAAFAVGHDEKHISVVDEGGVALAAIQGLKQEADEKDARIQQLEQTVNALQKLVEQMSQKLAPSKPQ
jgi:Chaperone of endosialidase